MRTTRKVADRELASITVPPPLIETCLWAGHPLAASRGCGAIRQQSNMMSVLKLSVMGSPRRFSPKPLGAVASLKISQNRDVRVDLE